MRALESFVHLAHLCIVYSACVHTLTRHAHDPVKNTVLFELILTVEATELQLSQRGCRMDSEVAADARSMALWPAAGGFDVRHLSLFLFAVRQWNTDYLYRPEFHAQRHAP